MEHVEIAQAPAATHLGDVVVTEAFEAIRALEEGSVRTPHAPPRAAEQASDPASILAELLDNVGGSGEEDAEEVLLRPREPSGTSPSSGLNLPELLGATAPPATTMEVLLAHDPSPPVLASSLSWDSGPKELPPQSSMLRSSPAPTSSDGVDLAQQFTCPICLEVCEEAVETPCCHNLFCRACLLSEEHRIDNCPICKCGLEATAVVANVPVRRMISDMVCACRFEGCSTQLRRRDRDRHEAECDFMPVQCRYSSRCQPLLRGQIAQHEASLCPYRPVLCPWGCGSREPSNRLEEHIQHDCPRVLLECEHCKAPVCRAELQEHVLSLCPLVVVTCGLTEDDGEECCQFSCERRLLSEHRNSCCFRPLRCQHDGCNVITTARCLVQHEESCEWKIVACHDCGAEVRAGLLRYHQESDCPEHLVACPFAVHGCQEVVPRRLLQEHIQQATTEHLLCLLQALNARDVEIANLHGEVVRLRKDLDQRMPPPMSPVSAAQVASSGSGPPRPSGNWGLGEGEPSAFARSSHAYTTPPPPPPPPPPAQPRHGVSASRGPARKAPPPNLQADSDAPPSLAGQTGPTTASGRASHAGGPAGPRNGDHFPGPAWDRDHVLSPPGALQPLMLLREGGVSQVPILVPPSRIQTHGASRGRLASSAPVGSPSPVPSSAAPIPLSSGGPRPSAQRPVVRASGSGARSMANLAFSTTGPAGEATVPPGAGSGPHAQVGAQHSPRLASPLRGDGADDLVDPLPPSTPRGTSAAAPESPPLARLPLVSPAPPLPLPQGLQAPQPPSPQQPPLPPGAPPPPLGPPSPVLQPALESSRPIPPLPPPGSLRPPLVGPVALSPDEPILEL